MYKHNDKKHINYVTASFFVPFLLFCPVLLHFFHSNPTTSPLDPRTHKRTRITGKEGVRAQRVKTSLFSIPALIILVFLELILTANNNMP